QDGAEAQGFVHCCHLVIDTGRGHTRSGLAGDEQPQSVVPSQAGGGPVLTHDMDIDWDGLEELWHRILYQKLGICPEEVAVLAVDTPLSPIASWEKVAELLFRSFGALAMLVLPHSLLAAYSDSCTTGMVVGSGAGTSYVWGFGKATHCPPCLAVAALTLHLGRLLGSRGVRLGAGPRHHLKVTCWCVLPGAGGPCPSPPRHLGAAAGEQAVPLPRGAAGPHCPAAPGAGGPYSLCHCGAPPAAPHPACCGQGAQRLAAKLRVPPHCRMATWLGGSLATCLDAFQGAWVPQDAYREGSPATVPPLLL
ncbi:ACT1 protein, partial [Herpetotheres cachinnans]|nr:ACT1 protein [Herpetotheres cachinnans]